MTASTPPNVVVLAGPNGSGKSTAGPAILRDTFGITEFVNADVIAQGLSAFAPEAVAIDAARIMLRRVRELADAGADFAFETTLSSRTFASWLDDLRQAGYHVHVVFLFLPTADFAVDRVTERIRAGGHAVLEDTVRRRYTAGLRNFFALYHPLADSWRIYDNSDASGPRLIAAGGRKKEPLVSDPAAWKRIQEEAARAAPQQ